MLRLPRVHVYTGERAERPDRSKRDLREREINLHHLITGAITGVLYVCLDGQGFTGLQRRRGEFRRDVLEFGIAQTVAKDVSSRYQAYGRTRNFTLLFSVLVGIVTVTKPVVAPVGTRVSIRDFETTLNSAAVPLKLTLVAPVRSVPRILTARPTLPRVGRVSTNGPRPQKCRTPCHRRWTRPS